MNPNFGKSYDIENSAPEGGEKLSSNRPRVRKLAVEEALKKYGKERPH